MRIWIELEKTQIPNDPITITPVLFTCKHRPGISVAHICYLFGHVEYFLTIETCGPNEFNSIRIYVNITTIEKRTHLMVL